MGVTPVTKFSGHHLEEVEGKIQIHGGYKGFVKE
jgi:hypothetical protein